MIYTDCIVNILLHITEHILRHEILGFFKVPFMVAQKVTLLISIEIFILHLQLF